MAMVSVLVVQAFSHDGRNVFPGDWVDMAPIDAVVKSRDGLVSLNHGTCGQTYQTRHLVATEPEVCAPVTFANPTSVTEPSLLKRRRGRPRKVKD